MNDEIKKTIDALERCKEIVIAGLWGTQACCSCPYRNDRNCRVKLLDDAATFLRGRLILEEILEEKKVM